MDERIIHLYEELLSKSFRKIISELSKKNTGLKEIVSFTVPANQRSIRVMEKLGMHHDPKDVFAHPKLAPDHPLSMHVLYRMR